MKNFRAHIVVTRATDIEFDESELGDEDEYEAAWNLVKDLPMDNWEICDVEIEAWEV